MGNLKGSIERYGLDERTQSSVAIGCTLDTFASTLPGYELHYFQAVGLSDQIDIACWELARPETEGGDPANLNRAINLRARHAQYSLEQYMLAPHGKQPWDYVMPVYENPFWQAVDKGFQTLIIKLARDTYKQYVSCPTVELPQVDEVDRTLAICDLNIQGDEKIKLTKHLRYAACKNVVTVTYLAQPH